MEAFLFPVRIPTPEADHHWTAALYYDEGITQVQKLPEASGTNVWSPRAEIPNHLGTCGSTGNVLSNTALKWFIFEHLVEQWVCSCYRGRSVQLVCFGCYLLCFKSGYEFKAMQSTVCKITCLREGCTWLQKWPKLLCSPFPGEMEPISPLFGSKLVCVNRTSVNRTQQKWCWESSKPRPQ